MAPCTRNSARNAQQEAPDKQRETQMADFSINLEKLATVSMWTAMKNSDSDGDGFLHSDSNDSEFTPDTDDEELAFDMDEHVSISSDQEYEQEYTVRSKKRREREGNRFGKIHIDLDKFMHKDEDGKELKSNASDWDGLNKRQKLSKKDSCPLNWEKWEKELEKWDAWKSNGDVNLDGLPKKKEPLDFMEPSADIRMPLLPFQKEWLAWSIQQERGESKGGILADEMGMGKTIQAIALVLTARTLRHVNFDSPNPSVDHCSNIANNADPKLLPHVKGTLVVCPLVAVIQWKSEISKFTAEGSTSVLVYHGAGRYKHVADLANYDFILTTYATIEAEYRKVANPSKRQCEWCGKTFLPRSLKLHLKHFCGPDAVKTEKQAKQVKKKVHSSYNSNMKKKVLKDDEDSEVEIFTEKKMGKLVRGKKLDIGSKKTTKRFDIIEGDIPASAKGYTQKPSEQTSSPLHSVEWERIILDEAHCIKDRRCNTSKAVFSLHSSYKWALSGTPLQNRVGELYSLVRFLQIFPYSYYFCKSCECKSLDYSFGTYNRECDHCHHSPLSHFCWWNKYVANPITRHGYKDQGKKALILLKHKVLNQIVLRRTKTERAADLALPPKAIFLRRDTFDAREEDFYQALYTQSRSQFNTYVAAGTVVNNYAHIFDLLTRLRQAVDHPYLVVYSRTSVTPSNNENTSSVISECPICHDQLDDPVTAQCGHSFCRVCIQSHPSRPGEATACSSCSKPLTVDLTDRTNTQTEDLMKKCKGSGILSRIDKKNFQTSTKIDALREEIHMMLQKDASAKAIVFSQFTSFLDLISFSLSKSGIQYVQLTGNMTIQARDQAIEKFTNDSKFKVFLMSLKAGGVALNLTVASHVFLMDPWWNPAVEQQAQDRIHRLGQYKPIRVVRFVIANTIEERILRLQEKKDLVFKGTVGRSEEALGRLTVDDLRFLFTN